MAPRKNATHKAQKMTSARKKSVKKDAMKVRKQKKKAPKKGHDMRRPASAVPKSGTSFLDLPAELRNQIYSLVLPRWVKGPWHWMEGTDSGRIRIGDQSHLTNYEPALLRCSKQIRQEACAMYYQRNHFSFYIRRMDFRSFNYWLRSLELLAATALADVKVFISRFRWDNAHHLLPLLQAIRESPIPENSLSLGVIRGGLSFHKVEDSFKRLLEMAFAAREEGLSAQQMEVSFDQFLTDRADRPYISYKLLSRPSDAREKGRFGLRSRSLLKSDN